jgi:hypothetical protein
LNDLPVIEGTNGFSVVIAAAAVTVGSFFSS